MERRLAAILAADVVGYSRLMEADEAGTLAALKTHREILIDPEIADHSGRVIKLMGDGALVEFSSRFIGPVPNIIVFQYNPEKLTRSLTPWQPPAPTPGEE